MASDTGNHSSPSPLGRLGSITLPRQMSIYSLTLDEFQSALGEPGKNFGSMNMDELLKNIWTAEESQAMAALFGDDQQQQQGGQGQQQQDQSSGPSPALPRQNSVIQRQNSVTLLPLPQELSKKTVDEVWKNISVPSSSGGGGDVGGGAGPSAAAAGTTGVQQTGRQTTYGEMTLEDFLVKAGVMTAETNSSPLPAIQGFPVASTMNQMAAAPKPILGAMAGMISKKEPIELNDPVLGIGLGASSSYSAAASSSNGYLTPAQAAARQQAEWMESQYKNSTALAQQQMLQLGYMNGGTVPGNASTMVMHGGLTGYSKEGSPGSPLSDAPGYGLSPNGTGYGFEGGLRGRKRILDAPLEKIVERRQRRMIKNRESAARSRARKQAYTVELEAEVNQLKEENMKLRKMQEEENMKKRKQLIGSMTQHLPKGLRRTLTGPW